MNACQDCAAPITQSGHGRRRLRCDECRIRRVQQRCAERYAALSPEKRQAVREYGLQKNYGIGVADFDVLLAAQGGRCAICDTDKPNGKGWQVDHDHKSGANRGILCHGCNVGLGNYRDDPAILRSAIAYLELHASRRVS